MLRSSKHLAGSALALFLCGAAAVAQAAEQIVFLYAGHGQISFAPCPSPAPTCAVATVNGAADDWAGLSSPIPGSWEVQIVRTLDLAAMTFTGTFAFVDQGAGGNSLYGSLTGAWGPHSPGYTKGQNFFTVEGGTGIFSGATGTGENTAYTHTPSGDYVDSGLFNVTTVPEPATTSMVGAGILAVMAMAMRRHRRG
jgi:hypothetical protein